MRATAGLLLTLFTFLALAVFFTEVNAARIRVEKPKPKPTNATIEATVAPTTAEAPEPTKEVTKKEKALKHLLKPKSKSNKTKKAKKTLKTTPVPTTLDTPVFNFNDSSIEENDFGNFTEPEIVVRGIEELCVRIHNNTAFAGIEPFDTQLLKNAYECQKACVATFPRCVAVMFYFVHNQTDEHICYLFDHNSIDPDVQLIEEKPKHDEDIIRALEIVLDCHQFDPFPPLGEDGIVSSTDKVPRSKRQSSKYIEIETTGPWTPWGQCLPSGVQARSQACEYGRKIQRRGCPARNYYAQMQQQQADQQYQQQQQQYFSQQQQHQQEAQERQRVIDQQRQQQQYDPRQQQQQSDPRQQQQQQQYDPRQQQEAERQRLIDQQRQQQSQQAAPTRPTEPVPYPPQGYQDDYQRQREEMERKREEHMREYERRQEEYNRLAEERRRLETERAQQGQGDLQARPPAPPAPPQYPPQTAQGVAQYPPPQQIYPSRGGEEQLHPAIPASQAQCPSNDCLPTPPQVRPPPPPAPACRSAACIPTRPPIGLWSEWSACSCTCGDGIKQRVCSTGDCGTGVAVENAPCSMQPCETWSEWCEWSPCSSSCGRGEKSRTRYCLLGTQRCEGKDFESEPCDSGPCPEWSQWEDWGQCSTSCGHGTQSRQRSCLGGVYGYQQCNGEKVENRPCDHGPCSTWSNWQEWGLCSVSCGDGVKRRERICQGGTDCIGESVEDIFCSGPPCAAWSQWIEWSACSAQCGPGQKTRSRQCQSPTGQVTEDCLGDKIETVLCNERECASWSEWCDWSPCDRDCGGGISLRSRVCEAPGSPYGDNAQCPGPDRETKRCNEHPCAPQCQWTEWCPWSPCSAYSACDTGVSSRSRQCVGEAGCSCRGLAEESQQCQGTVPCTPPPPQPQQPC